MSLRSASETTAKRSRSAPKSGSRCSAEWSWLVRSLSMASPRSVLLTARVEVNRSTFDPTPFRADLARIGNNINQIARNVNVHDATTTEEMIETRKLLRQVQQVITEATGRRP